MLHQDLRNAPPHQPPFAWSALPPAEALLDLLADARRALHEDPGSTGVYLDRIAALFEQPERDDDIERLLLPRLPAGANTRMIKGGLAGWQLRRVLDHIDQTLDGTVLIETLAGIARLSAGHFCRAFKASIGETPHNFLVRQRIRRAQALMLRTDDALSQIACACGLTDQAHLTRLFRKLVGDTPLAWRRTWRQPR
jgi:AraC family transcriptional regulator